ncbi:hypothetical protein [Halorubrum spindle-shaped virus-BLv25]|nr:hypothetical protein [Halorubrum spindle-shaped virus-BLv25]
MSDPDKALEEMDISIEKELDTILPGSDPLANLKAEHEGGLEYSVLSVRDGSPTYHYVTLGEEPSCTCEDYQYNRENREVCKHICKAILADQMEPDRLAVRELINVTATVTQAASTAREAANEARSTATELDNALVQARDFEAGKAADSTDSSGSEQTENQGASDNSGSHSNAPEAEAAAEKLQSAFDSVFEGMAVEHNEGMVWVNKTPQAPDTLPGPGNVEVFSAMLQEPDQIEYVHDNHDYKGAEPGQYFSNMIDPSDVDDYISEVLE